LQIRSVLSVQRINYNALRIDAPVGSLKNPAPMDVVSQHQLLPTVFTLLQRISSKAERESNAEMRKRDQYWQYSTWLECSSKDKAWLVGVFNIVGQNFIQDFEINQFLASCER
jgi:hypothetical protein